MEKDCNDIRFTQFLYRLKDCISAFVITLVKRDDIEIVLFWASEIILSGYPSEFAKLLLCVYFDFFVIDSPTMEKTINKKIVLFQQTKNIEHLFFIVIRLHHESKKRRPHLFHYNHLEWKKPPKINIKQGEPFLKKFISKINCPLQIKFIEVLHLFHCEKKPKRWEHIAYLTREMYDKYGAKFIIQLLNKYLCHCKTISLYANLPSEVLTFKSHFIKMREEKENILSCVFVNFFLDAGVKPYLHETKDPKETKKDKNKKVRAKPKIVRLSKKNKTFLNSIKLHDGYYHNFIDTGNCAHIIPADYIKPYRILEKFRLCGLPEEITCFRKYYAECKKKRLTLEFLRLSQKWMYFARNVPFWKNKLDRYEYKVNHKRKLITFYTDKDFEDFSKHFNFEPDECEGGAKFQSLLWYKNCENKKQIEDWNKIENFTQHLHFLNNKKINSGKFNKYNGITRYFTPFRFVNI